MSQEDRSEALIQVLEELEQSDIGFVLIGGYAISQRSSVEVSTQDFLQPVVGVESQAEEVQITL